MSTDDDTNTSLDPSGDQPSQQSQTSLFDAPPAQLPARLTSGTDLPRFADVVLTPEQEVEAAERWPDASKKKQIVNMKHSIVATLRHKIVADDGTGRRVFGGPQPGSGRPKRLDETLVAAAESRQKEIIDAAFAPLSPGNPAMDRHRAAMNLAREAREVREQERRDDELDGASKDDLIKGATAVIAELLRSGEISVDDLDRIVDADVVDAA